MNVQEIKSKISEITSGKTVEQITVEFVIDDKKYFIQDMKAGTDTMEINVSRSSYRPTSLSNFTSTLEHASSNLSVSIQNQDNSQSYQIENLFCSEVFVEITVQTPA